MQTQNGINSYSQGDLQRMIRQVSDLYTQTAEATAKENEDASTLSEAGGENFKVALPSMSLCGRIHLKHTSFMRFRFSCTVAKDVQSQASGHKRDNCRW